MLAEYSTSTLMDGMQAQGDLSNTSETVQGRVFLFVGNKSTQLRAQFERYEMFKTSQLVSFDDSKEAISWLQTERSITTTAIVCDASYSEKELRLLKSSSQQPTPPLVLYNDDNNAKYHSKAVALSLLAEDFLYDDLGLSNIKERIVFLSELKKLEAIKHTEEVAPGRSVNHRVSKRVFDILVALLCIIIVSPLLLLIVIAIKLESRGPVLFVSERAGAGYKIFNFYKFRTMQTNADQMRNHLKTLNTYYAKDRELDKKDKPFFFKVKNDPRVTRVGRILRKTSLDELPQLFNVLKGDMSLVGNRPLPLDEGASLTIDHWADRFLAPAGMTGLWQIAKNKDSMSVAERINLDLEYVKHSSFWLDMQILLRTIPAMLQRE